MNSIQRKIWFHSMIVLFFMAAIWTALTYYNQKTQNQYNEILQRYLRLNEVTNASQQMILSLNTYLYAPTSNNQQELNQSIDVMRQAKYGVLNLSNAENHFALTNYVNLIDSLIETTNRSIIFQLEQEPEGFIEAFSEATRISNYLSEMSLTLLDTELKTYDRFYRGIIEQSKELNKLGILLLILITLLLIMFTYWFSLSITRPIKKLTQAANQLSRGRFDVQIEIESNDEISFLAKTFDRMRVNINNLISEIQEKAQLEHELQENKLLLQETQLLSLQSQINPHFLFNTLDTLSKKAYLEGAEHTSDLIVNVANLLRYNLRRLDRAVTLAEEVSVMLQYIEIQKARFTERLQFIAEIDEACSDVLVPCLTLQPIIENAIIHAVEPSEEGGVIYFRVKDGANRVIIEIEDNGPGMSELIIQQILQEISVPTEGHSTGIGFSNVVKRLRLFYGIEDVIDIESNQGVGTTVIFKIPKSGGGIVESKALDRG